jgi:hypothetical protein
MKKILLSSAAIVAFAGAASADISWTGSASLGYNDEVEDGVYADADVNINASTELNNGWIASLTYGFELQERNESGGANQDAFSGDNNVLVSLTNGTYGIFYGDTEFAAAGLWSGVSEMDEDNFSEQDGEDVLKFTATVGQFDLAYSTHIQDSTNESGQDSFGAAATFGNFDVTLGYQEEVAAEASQEGDFVTEDVFGISVGTSIAGVDVTFAYADSDGEDSTGLEVSYPVGDVTLGAFYVSESALDDNYGISANYAAGALEAKIYYKSLNDNDEYGLGGTYDLGNGLVLAAGYIDGDSTSDDDFGGYIAADYDLGGGASLLASYADQENGSTDDLDTVVGGYELNDGFTVLLELDF